MINDNATSNKVKLKTKIAVEKYLKAPMWKTTKSKTLFNGQNAPSCFEAIHPPLCISPKIIETKPKTATPIKLIIKNMINTDFMLDSIYQKIKRVSKMPHGRRPSCVAEIISSVPLPAQAFGIRQKTILSTHGFCFCPMTADQAIL